MLSLLGPGDENQVLAFRNDSLENATKKTEEDGRGKEKRIGW